VADRILVVDDSSTLRKVVCAILSRQGYDAVAAADGQTALELLATAEAPFDLVLLDFVMPKMNGFQFCRAVRAREEWKKLPVLLMSAKTDRIREQFVMQTGAVDAITKPFDAQALALAVENALRRVRAGVANAPALVLDEGDMPLSTRSPQAREESAMRARVAVELGAQLANVLAPVLARLPADAIGDEAKIMRAIARDLSPEALAELGGSLGRADVGSEVVLSGNLAAIPIGAVLQLLQLEAQTGSLAIQNAASEITISMRGGLVDLVQARGASSEFRLGRFFLEEGLVTSNEIEDIVKKNSDAPDSARSKLLGDLLLESGRVSAEQLKEALSRQSSELIYELLRWQAGRFHFHRGVTSELADKARLALPVASIVMEGFRRVDEWRVIESKLGSFDAVLTSDPATLDTAGAEVKLARQERAVLEAVDGERSVREIIAASNLSSFDACRILFQLLEARLVRRRAA
jgi:DNA-binding response OmpR family regulator